jgi:hypothetical protein
MRSKFRRVVLGIVTTFALGLGLAIAGPATTASASAAACEGGANGFIDISDDLSGNVARSLYLGAGVTITLQYGNVAGAQRGWAKISGSTLNGDLVWMDWTTNGGASWLQCGPFVVDRGNGTSKTSAAKRTSSSTSYKFRACGKLLGGSTTKCTTWW